jgi:hypothetical protein
MSMPNNIRLGLLFLLVVGLSIWRPTELRWVAVVVQAAAALGLGLNDSPTAAKRIEHLRAVIRSLRSSADTIPEQRRDTLE